MEKISESASQISCRPNIFLMEDVPKIKKVIEQIRMGAIGQQRAADQYGATRYQVRKWYDLLKDDASRTSEEELDLEYRKKVVREMHSTGMRLQDASRKYNICVDTLRRWKQSMPGMVTLKPAKRISTEGRIERIVKIETAHKVQKGELSQFRAARELKVTRYTVRKWVSTYPIANFEDNINYEVMASDEKVKQLEKELERLKKELENEKLRNEGLKTLIEVAEDKFGIKIKKKPGSGQQPK